MDSVWEKRRKRLFEIVEVGASNDRISRGYDFLGVFFIVTNLVVSTMYTFDNMRLAYGGMLLLIERVTVAYFAADYILRLITARYLRPHLTEGAALRLYALSPTGIVDLLSFLPYYLPVFFPAGAVAFRMFRVIRIFRIFRINAYYDSLNVITEVISSKKQQLMSSVFIILVLMLASSLCMYSLEHEAQPEVFVNAFSGIWWSVSTLLTVGYGDIYPITFMGKVFSIFITFLGVGMVAIPTGIISAGFVDQYTQIKRRSEYASETEVHFIRIHLTERDRWVGKTIQELGLPAGVIIAAIRRNNETIVPRGNVPLIQGDTLVIGAEPYLDNQHVDLKEIELLENHPWNGMKIRNLDISRQTMIVMIKRGNRIVIPNGNLILRQKDKVVLYTQTHLANARSISI